MADAKLKLLHGPDAHAALGGEGVRVYGYILNKPAVVLLMVMSAAFYGLGGYLWWQEGLGELVWVAAFVVLCLVGSAFSIAALYWQNYAKTRIVAVSDEHLFIGTRDEVWRINWDLLDLEALGVTEMELSKLSGRMVVNVGAERIPLDIFRGFVVLDDVPSFILAILEKLDPDVDLEDLVAEEEAEREANGEE